MGKIVTKFGGSSLADASQFKKVKSILDLDPRRCYVVPSAPGRRFDGDDKITDLLYKCYRMHKNGEDIRPVVKLVRERFCGIAEELKLEIEITEYLDEVERDILADASADYCASRGEYLNGLLLADYLGFMFLDPKDFIFFNKDGTFNSERTNDALTALLKYCKKAVIPGFYGSMDDEIHTFSRGGSDISGAIVARAAKAELYENWTDVSGFLMADPRVVPGANLPRTARAQLHGRKRAARGQRVPRSPCRHRHQHPQYQCARGSRHAHFPQPAGNR